MTDTTPASMPQDESPARLRDLAAILLLTVAADLCLYAHPGGSGAGALIVATLLGLFLLAPGKLRGAGAALAATLVLAAGMAVWNGGLAVGLVAAVGMTAFAVKLHRPDWTVTEILWAVPGTVLRAGWRLAEILVRPVANLLESETEAAGKKNRIPLRRILIPVGVTFLFLLVFIAASPVVEKAWKEGWDSLWRIIEPLFENITFLRVMSWCGWLLVFAALVRPVIRSIVADWMGRWKETLSPPEDKAAEGGDFATGLVTLICVNALFLAFNALDSVYLYFKADLPDGITWAQYAHNGCFWLTVALALSTATIGILFGCGLNFHARSGTLRLWSYLWAAQNVILAAGALRRLQMYVDYNGLTRLRIVGLYGILLVLLGLGLMVWKVGRSRSFVWLLRRDMVALWAALVALALTPQDYICWRLNVRQVMAGNLRPLALLVVQPVSPEGYPPLLRLLDHPEPWVREGVAAYLGKRALMIPPSEGRAWTEWQGADVWASGRLGAAMEKIENIVPREGWTIVEKEFFDRVRPWVHSGVPLDFRD